MDRYKVAQKINSGAFGAVFEALDKKSGRKVAIKKVAKKFYEFNQRQRNREVKALNELKHPNLITLLDFVEKGGSLFFIFEYMDFNLYEIICNRGGEHFPLNLIQTALSQILLGLEFMHSSGFFHRDLKPENILVTQNCVKIADFGQVHELKTNGKKLTPYVSTRWYRAPEVLLGYRFYGSAIDLWAVGAIAAELMTLRPLFPGITPLDQINKLCSVLGSPSQVSQGGPWPLGSQLAALAGIRFPRQATGTFMDSLEAYPLLTPSCTHFITSLLQFDPNNRMTANQALQHDFFSCNSQSSSPLSSYTGSLATSSDDLDIGLPAITISPGLSFYTSCDLEASGSEFHVSLLQDCSHNPSPFSDQFPNHCPSVPNRSPTHKDIPMQAVHSLPISDSRTYPLKKHWGSCSIESSPKFNERGFHRLSLYDILDSPEIRSLAISRSNTEPYDFGNDSPPPPKSLPLNTTISVPGVQTEPKAAAGLRRMSKIPQGKFTTLRRLSRDYGKFLNHRPLGLEKASPEFPENFSRSSLEAELLGLMDHTFGNIAADSSLCKLSGSWEETPYIPYTLQDSHNVGAGIRSPRSLDIESVSGEKYDLATFLSQPASSHGSPLPQNFSRSVSKAAPAPTPIHNQAQPRRGSISLLFGKVRHMFARGSRPVAPLPCTPGVECVETPSPAFLETCWNYQPT